MKTVKKTVPTHVSQAEAAVAEVAHPADSTAVPPAPAALTTVAVTAPAAPTAVVSPSSSAASSGLAVIPTEDQVTQLVNLLDGVKTLLGSVAVALTAEQRKRALRAKKGGETMTRLMIALGAQYNVQLPGVDPQQIQQLSLLVQRLQPLDMKLRVVSGLVSDTVGNARTESWQGTTSLYTALARVAKRNPVLQKELTPAVSFFKRRKKASTKKGASATTAAVPAVVSTASGDGAPGILAPAAPVISATPAAQAPVAAVLVTK